MLTSMVEAERTRAAKPRRRWFQFSLATLLLVMTLFAVWLGWRTDRAHRQRRAVAALRALGGEVAYFHGGLMGPNDPQPPGPAWLRNLIGVDFFDKVVAVSFEQGAVGDEDLRYLEDLPDLVRLVIASPEVTDAGNAAPRSAGEAPDPRPLRASRESRPLRASREPRPLLAFQEPDEGAGRRRAGFADNDLVH